MADGEKALDEVGFDSVDELLAHYNFDGSPQKVELVLLDSDDKVLDHGFYNTKDIF
ncbi:hypothetical protein KY382_33010 [Pseudomonas monteilii]|nr:hypothetical protein [Pseudomonas monteilii]